jgi:hypothetical protein
MAKDLNTVIEPGVPVAEDIAAINAGLVPRVGDLFVVNGRTYQVVGGNHLTPVSGPGFHPLERPAFQALGVYNKFGNTPRANEILDQMAKTDPKLTQAQREAALRAWQAGQAAGGQ